MPLIIPTSLRISFNFCTLETFLFCGSLQQISFMIHPLRISKSSLGYFEMYLFLRTEVLLYPFILIWIPISSNNSSHIIFPGLT